jgi:hypothetical protein
MPEQQEKHLVLICPLMSGVSGNVECAKGGCAWWLGGNCCIPFIAEMLLLTEAANRSTKD